WRYAFPLLQKYEMRAVVFVIPGFTSDTDRRRPNLTDVWAGRCSLADLSAIDPHDTSLCSWIELATMHQTGLIDVESHSLFHGEVFDDLQIKDFLLPDSSFAPFETSMTAYLEPRDAASRPSHESYYGLPIFSTTPLYAGVPRWKATDDLTAKARSLYAEAGTASNYNSIRPQRCGPESHRRPHANGSFPTCRGREFIELLLHTRAASTAMGRHRAHCDALYTIARASTGSDLVGFAYGPFLNQRES